MKGMVLRKRNAKRPAQWWTSDIDDTLGMRRTETVGLALV